MEPAAGDDGITALDRLQPLLVFALAALLGSDEEEVEETIIESTETDQEEIIEVEEVIVAGRMRI